MDSDKPNLIPITLLAVKSDDLVLANLPSAVKAGCPLWEASVVVPVEGFQKGEYIAEAYVRTAFIAILQKLVETFGAK